MRDLFHTESDASFLVQSGIAAQPSPLVFCTLGHPLAAGLCEVGDPQLRVCVGWWADGSRTRLFGRGGGWSLSFGVSLRARKLVVAVLLASRAHCPDLVLAP